MKAQVQAALEEIRPYIQADGGDVELISVENGVVTIRMMGHCVGCPSSQITLRQGIEQHLRKRVPEVVDIVAQEGAPAAPGAGPMVSPFAGGPVGAGGTAAAAPATKPDAASLTAHLRETHRKAEKELVRLEAACAKLAAGEGGAAEIQAAQEVHAFLEKDLMVHMRQEDEVLFPALINLISWGSPMSVMAKEHHVIHDEIRELGERIREVEKGAGDKEALNRLAKRLAQRLRDDFYQEENVLFVEADESIVGSRARSLQEAMERIVRATERDEKALSEK